MSDDDGRCDRILRLSGALFFEFLSKLPNGPSDLKSIKNAPAIFGAVFEFANDTLSIASTYKQLLTWAPALLAALEDAGVEVWDGHGSVEAVRTKFGKVVDGEDKLATAKEKWPFGSMVGSSLGLGWGDVLMCCSCRKHVRGRCLEGVRMI